MNPTHTSDAASEDREAQKPNGQWRDATAETVAEIATRAGAALPVDGEPEWEHATSGRARGSRTEKPSDEWIDALVRAEQADSDKFESEDEIWDSTRYKAAGYGLIGVDYAILLATAFLYRTQPAWTDERIVDHVMERVRSIKDRDAPNERWDWRQERREIADKLQRYKVRLAQKSAAVAATPTGRIRFEDPNRSATVPAAYRTISKTADQFEEEATVWLWDNHIPLGGLSMVMGQTKVGKSQKGIWLLSTVSTGLPFPSLTIGTPKERAPAEGVLVTAEDSIERAVVPRLKAAKADLTRIHIVQGYAEVQQNGEQLEKRFSLEKSIEALSDLLSRHPNIRLVVIDPVNAYLGGKIDAWKNDQVRSVLQPLKELAEKFKVAVVLVHHMKKGQKQGSVLDMSGGSNAFVETVRAVFAMAQEPGTEEDPVFRGVLTLERASYAKAGHSYVYQIQEHKTALNRTTHFVLLDKEQAPMSVSQALDGSKKVEGGKDKEREAIDFVLGMLGGGEVLQSDIQKAAQKEEVSFDMTKKVKVKLGVRSRREGFGPGSKMYWSLPPKAELDVTLERVLGFAQLTPEEMASFGRDAPPSAPAQQAPAKVKAPAEPAAGTRKDLVLKPIRLPCCDDRRAKHKAAFGQPVWSGRW